MKQPIPFSHFADNEMASIKNGSGQSVVRLRPDLYGYIVYLASISRKNVTEVIDEALRYAFSNAAYTRSDVYDITYGTATVEEATL